MAESSYTDLTRELDEACAFVRAFARGCRGFTRQDGLAGVRRLNEVCDRMEDRFLSGASAGAAEVAVARGRAHVVEAGTRLAAPVEPG